MPWMYSQSTGTLTDPSGAVVGAGYSGCADGYNNSSMQAIENVGPIPQGGWAIGAAFTHALAGPTTMRLIPLPGAGAFGRDGFLIHGDTQLHTSHPTPENSASHGCVVLSRALRSLISLSDDRVLVVIE